MRRRSKKEAGLYLIWPEVSIEQKVQQTGSTTQPKFSFFVVNSSTLLAARPRPRARARPCARPQPAGAAVIKTQTQRNDNKESHLIKSKAKIKASREEERTGEKLH